MQGNFQLANASVLARSARLWQVRVVDVRRDGGDGDVKFLERVGGVATAESEKARISVGHTKV